jgi:hypothetical protein
VDPGDVAAGPIEAGDETGLDRIRARGEHDRNGCGRGLRSKRCRRTDWRDDDGDATTDQIRRQFRQLTVFIVRPAVFDRHVLAFDIAGFVQTLAERGNEGGKRLCRAGDEEADNRQRWLLRTRPQRPRGRPAAKQSDELAPFH